MKISPEIYVQLKADILSVCTQLQINLKTADGGKTGLKTAYLVLDMVSRNRAFDDSHPGFAQGHWKRVLPYDGREFCWYYANGCNDTHVATALRNIIKEFPDNLPAAA